MVASSYAVVALVWAVGFRLVASFSGVLTLFLCSSVIIIDILYSVIDAF